MEWSIPEPAEMATIRWNDPPEGWSTFWLLAKPAGSGIMDLFESRTGVDVEAGCHINDPPFWSSIASMVAKPAGTCIIHDMMNKTYTTEYHDKTMDFRVVRWTQLSDSVRSGESIDRFDTEEEAMEVAAILNEGLELDLFLNQSCEFDS